MVYGRDIWLLIRYKKRENVQLPTKVNLADYQDLSTLDAIRL